MILLGRWLVYAVRMYVWAVIWDRNKVIDLWRWEVREVLLYKYMYVMQSMPFGGLISAVCISTGINCA